MGIESQLKDLVLCFTTLDQKLDTYAPITNPEDKLKIKQRFIQLINKQLLLDGYDKECVEKRYKALSMVFHTDRISYSKEAKWLEHTLSDGLSNGLCFILLTDCFQKYMNPQKFKDIQFKDVNNRAELKAWLELQCQNAKHYNQKLLYSSLIQLVDQATGYFDAIGELKPVGLRSLLTMLPLLFTTYGAVILGPELFAIYSVYFFILKGGQMLEKQDNQELQKVGGVLQKISKVTATATSIIIVKILEMTFWFTHMVYDMTKQIGFSESSQKSSELSPEQALCRDIIIASKDLLTGKEFQNPEMKLIAAPLESYLGLNKQQYLQFWRAGKDKYFSITQLVFQLEAYDKDEELALPEKIKKSKEEISSFQQNKKINNGKTEQALNASQKLADFLLETEQNKLQLIMYKEPILESHEEEKREVTFGN